jgi:DNA-binding NtrC family response regulator
MPEKILVVDDEEEVRFMLREALAKRGFEPVLAPDAETALELLRAGGLDLVLLDIMLPGMDGIQAIPKIQEIDPQVPILMMTAHGSRDIAVRAIQAGAYDFFDKPFKIDELTIVVRRALEKRSLAREVSTLAERLDARLGFDNIIGQSGAMRDVLALVAKVVATDVTVLIRGESGTGKGLIAQAIHHNSPRRDRPFVKLNCVAIPETLLESELFGYEKGAFTGALGRRLGRFEQANTGTIFLDEIGDMTPATQAKILRVLQDREFERLGGGQSIKTDVRILAATNKNLSKAVEDGSFREDLYYRLNVFAIHLPPLRDRKDDIPPLAGHFVAQFSGELGKRVTGFSAEAMRTFLTYDWPGNVRELENCVRRAIVLADSDLIGTECLESHLVTYQPRIPEEPAIEPGRSLDDTLESIERKLILSALRRTGGVQSRAAKVLGITERSLWHRIKKLAIDVDNIRDTGFDK